LVKPDAKALKLFRTLFIGTSFLIWICHANAAQVADSTIHDDSGFTSPQAEVRAYAITPQALVTFSFDDASPTVYDTAFPILHSRGLPATFYFITSFLTEQWKTQLQSLEDHGWEIGSHTRTHPDLTTLNKADLITELSGSKSDLEAAGLTVSGFAYPYGAADQSGAVVRQIKQYYAYARSASLGYNIPLVKRYALKTRVVTSSTPLAALEDWVDEAISNRQWLILVLHTVDTTGNIYSISPSDLSELASYIKAKVDGGNISAVTVREGIARYDPTGWNPIYDTSALIEKDLAITNGRVLWYFGSDVVDYLYDGYEWVESGQTRYYELNGKNHTINIPSDVSLQFISPSKATAQFTLGSIDGEASVTSTITLVSNGPLAEVRITDIHGTPTILSLGKDLARRFSINDGVLVTDGSLEIGMRIYGDSSQSFFAFDSTTDSIRILTHGKAKVHSEYSDYAKGEFRSMPIRGASELPYTWFVGGIAFETLGLLLEAESGILSDTDMFYTDGDASPKTGNTGIVLDEPDEAVTLQFTPPAQGNFILSIRQKGATTGDQYSYQIDGGEVFTRTGSDTYFGYENMPLKDLTVFSHTLKVSQVSGTVIVDYGLLVPISRSNDTPVTADFPADVARQIFNRVFLPLVIWDNYP
jgi:peptidoglycan/xylan/chitin deacetylase (PgdA/CDA1 family)